MVEVGDCAIQKASMLSPQEAECHMLFQHFKMALHNFRGGGASGGGAQLGPAGPTVKPHRGPQLHVPVRHLFAQILRIVVEDALGPQGRITQQFGVQRIGHINWQVCHPANFPEAAKEVLRFAARDAGIKEECTGEVDLQSERLKAGHARMRC